MFQIKLPTGATVVFESKSIKIYASVIETDQTRGMCGTFNLDCTDEFYYRGEPLPLKDPAFTAGCPERRLGTRETEDFSTTWK